MKGSELSSLIYNSFTKNAVKELVDNQHRLPIPLRIKKHKAFRAIIYHDTDKSLFNTELFKGVLSFTKRMKGVRRYIEKNNFSFKGSFVDIFEAEFYGFDLIEYTKAVLKVYPNNPELLKAIEVYDKEEELVSVEVLNFRKILSEKINYF